MPNWGCEVAVETRGIRYVHLVVGDHDRSVGFYRDLFGLEVGFRDGNILFLHSPTQRDDLALHIAVSDTEKARVGDQGGYEHFGITVKDRTQLDECIALAIAAGGTLVDRGEHAPGVPYAYITDQTATSSRSDSHARNARSRHPSQLRVGVGNEVSAQPIQPEKAGAFVGSRGLDFRNPRRLLGSRHGVDCPGDESESRATRCLQPGAARRRRWFTGRAPVAEV